MEEIVRKTIGRYLAGEITMAEMDRQIIKVMPVLYGVFADMETPNGGEYSITKVFTHIEKARMFENALWSPIRMKALKEEFGGDAVVYSRIERIFVADSIFDYPINEEEKEENE